MILAITMNQDASNMEGEGCLPSIPNGSNSELAEAGDGRRDTITTPEAVMDIDLPRLLRIEEMDNTPRKKIGMEIPDSEEASEMSSPVKVDRAEEEKRNEAAELDSGVQITQEMSEQELGQENTPRTREKVMRTEIPDSEEASEFSSPIKVAVGAKAAGDGAVQSAGRMETIGEGQEQDIEEGDTTMMDVPAPVQGDGLVEEKESRVETGSQKDATKMSGSGTAEFVDATWDVDYTIEKGEGLPSTVNGEGAGQMAPSEVTLDEPSADTSPRPDETKNHEPQILPARANIGAVIHQTPPSKEDAESMAPPAQAFSQLPVSSPATHAKNIAIAARRLLADEIPLTISDTSDTTEEPKLLKNITAVPDSDEDEDDELPDSTGIRGRAHVPVTTMKIDTDEGIPKAADIPVSVSNTRIAQQGENIKATPPAPLLKEEAAELDTLTQSEFTSSPSKAVIAKLSQAINVPSSSSESVEGASFKAKRKESPSPSFTPREATQSKDILMAELKVMKIASIQNRISGLEAEIASKRMKLEEVTKDLKQPAAETVKRHIKLLHDYNDIRDVGQGLVGMIADNRGVRIGELYNEFGIGLKD